MTYIRHMAVAALLLLAACGGDKAGPTPIEVEGNWSGTTGAGSVLVLTLTESSGTVTGTGTFSTTTQSAPLSATGTWVEPHLSATLTSEGFQNLNLSTTVGKTSMTGTLNGSGFLNEAITLTRQ